MTSVTGFNLYIVQFQEVYGLLMQDRFLLFQNPITNFS